MKSPLPILLGIVFTEAFIGTSPCFLRRSLVYNKGLHKDISHRSNLAKIVVSAVPPEEYEHARELFTLVDTDNSGTICESELGALLAGLEIETTSDEAKNLFAFLDKDGDGELSFDDEFKPWYDSILESTLMNRDIVQKALLSRSTVNDFDPSLHVSDHVLHRAIQCAIAAPNHKITEPWRFIKLGNETITKIATLNAQSIKDPEKAEKKRVRWENIPGWCVVTSRLSNDCKVLEMEDYAATCCAIQNFMLSMWIEGVGTKWTSGDITRTQGFADLCGIDVETEQVVGCIWYGFASIADGRKELKEKKRKKGLEDVLTELP